MIYQRFTQVASWTNGGLAEFRSALWPAGVANATLSLASPGSFSPLPFTFSAQRDVTRPVRPSHEAPYFQTTWYGGSVDEGAWANGSAPWPPGGTTDDFLVSLSAPPIAPFTFPAFTCANVAVAADGGNTFYRQVTFPTALPLVVTPPGSPGGAWPVTVAPCGAAFVALRIPISPSTAAADAAASSASPPAMTSDAPSPPAWCSVWPALTPARPGPITISIRSVSDPVIAMGFLTACSDAFGRTRGGETAWSARALLLPGVFLTAASFAAAASLLARRRATAAAAARAGFVPSSGGGGGGGGGEGEGEGEGVGVAAAFAAAGGGLWSPPPRGPPAALQQRWAEEGTPLVRSGSGGWGSGSVRG